MTKINGCRQKDGDICHEYPARLTELHNAHSGIEVPADINQPEVTVWEAHLRNCFLNGMDAEISEKVKDLCVTCDSAKLNVIVAHANHAEKRLRDARKVKIEKRNQDLEKATITMFQNQNQTRGRGRGGRGRGNQGSQVPQRFSNNGKPMVALNTCFVCGQMGHWSSNCPEADNGQETFGN